MVKIVPGLIICEIVRAASSDDVLMTCPQVVRAVVEPYNTVLSGHSLLEHKEVTIRIDLGLMHQPLLSSRRHREVRAA